MVSAFLRIKLGYLVGVAVAETYAHLLSPLLQEGQRLADRGKLKAVRVKFMVEKTGSLRLADCG